MIHVTYTLCRLLAALSQTGKVLYFIHTRALGTCSLPTWKTKAIVAKGCHWQIACTDIKIQNIVKCSTSACVV